MEDHAQAQDQNPHNRGDDGVQLSLLLKVQMHRCARVITLDHLDPGLVLAGVAANRQDHEQGDPPDHDVKSNPGDDDGDHSSGSSAQTQSFVHA
ncbi:hypothetical protein ABI_35180 [Asticcacaulis biprosthecium C19]|uniref:Uncharacterized protein n=1 Tax=Asticcacaulis biprosthecium C19 TaxID=715226 RepID=F4QQK7_9CAUL|nr:hypothetical protein ABI_35180 [Asticcacaulis biprosthecium C19]